MLLEHYDINSRSSEKQSKHRACRAAAGNAARDTGRVPPQEFRHYPLLTDGSSRDLPAEVRGRRVHQLVEQRCASYLARP
ncbi:MAG: hypothetical protein NVS4B3_02920 [Gemmatimonadaceae bacterium]